MANTYSQNLQLVKPSVGGDTNAWGGHTNTDWDIADQAAVGVLSLNVAGSSNVTLTATAGSTDQSKYRTYILTGLLTGNIIVFWPLNLTRAFTVVNETTGPYTVTLGVLNGGATAAAGITQAAPQGTQCAFYSDGTNIGSQSLRTPAGTNYQVGLSAGNFSSPFKLYVASTGSDTANNGVTAATPFATIQHAYDTLRYFYDGYGTPAVIEVADGTYAHGLNATGVGYIGFQQVTIQGNNTTPANVLIQETTADCFYLGGAANQIFLSGMKLATSVGNGIEVVSGGVVDFSNMDFGVCRFSHMACSLGASISAETNYTISGGAANHLNVVRAGADIEIENVAINISNPNLAFSIFAYCSETGVLNANGTTFTGSYATVTGTRYNVQLNGVIYTNSGTLGVGNPTFFPGSIAGSNNGGPQAGGGIYS